MTHPAISPGRTAVITGAASGIGLAAAKRFAGLGLNVVLADLAGEKLNEAAAAVASLAPGGASAVRARFRPTCPASTISIICAMKPMGPSAIPPC